MQSPDIAYHKPRSRIHRLAMVPICALAVVIFVSLRSSLWLEPGQHAAVAAAIGAVVASMWMVGGRAWALPAVVGAVLGAVALGVTSWSSSAAITSVGATIAPHAATIATALGFAAAVGSLVRRRLSRVRDHQDACLTLLGYACLGGAVAGLIHAALALAWPSAGAWLTMATDEASAVGTGLSSLFLKQWTTWAAEYLTAMAFFGPVALWSAGLRMCGPDSPIPPTLRAAEHKTRPAKLAGQVAVLVACVGVAFALLPWEFHGWYLVLIPIAWIAASQGLLGGAVAAIVVIATVPLTVAATSGYRLNEHLELELFYCVCGWTAAIIGAVASDRHARVRVLTASEDLNLLVMAASTDGVWDVTFNPPWRPGVDLGRGPTSGTIELSARCAELVGLAHETRHESLAWWESLFVTPKAALASDEPTSWLPIKSVNPERSHLERFTSESQVRRADGEVRWVQLQGVVLRDHDNLVRRVVGSLADITDRKHATAVVDRDRKLFAEGRAVLVRWRPEPGGPIEFISESAKQFGYRPDDLLGKKFMDLVHPDDRERVTLEARAAIAGGLKGMEQRYRLRRGPIGLAAANGHAHSHAADAHGHPHVDAHTRADDMITIYDYTSIARDQHGRAVALDGYLIDDTQRQRLETALRSANAVLRALAESQPFAEQLGLVCKLVEAQSPGLLCAIMLLDSTGRRLHTGAAPSLDPLYSAMVNGVEIGPCVGSCGTAAFTNETVIVEDIQTNSNWADFKVSAERFGLRACWSVPIHDRQGAVLGTFAMYRRSPSKPTPEELSLAIEARHLAGVVIESQNADVKLRESEQRLRTLMNYAPDSIVVFDVDRGVFADCNPAAEKLFGLSRTEMLSRSVPEMSPATQPDGRLSAEAMKPWITAALAGETPVFRWTHLCTPNRPVLCEVRLARMPSPSVRLVRGSLRDITSEVELEEASTRRTVALERSNRELEQFAYIASHDLQEPLRMVVTFTRLLAERLADKLDDECREWIGFAADGAERMHRMISDLLEYARLETREPRRSRIEPRAAFERALANLHAVAAEVGADIRVGELPLVNADAAALSMIAQNLLGNAIKFRRGVKPVVIVSSSRKGDKVCFRVEDDGIGIPERSRERVFGMFQRLNSRESYPGSGMGLSLCQRAVAAAGGEIWIEDSQLGGTAVCFTLPAADTTDAEPVVTIASHSPPEGVPTPATTSTASIS